MADNILAPPAQQPMQIGTDTPTGQMPAGQPDILPNPQVAQAQEAEARDAEMAASGKLDIEAEEPDEKEQEDYDQLVYNFAKYAYKDGRDAVLRRMNNPDEPVWNNVAATQHSIMREMIAQAEETTGEPLSPDAIYHAAAEQIAILMDLGDAAGIFPFDQKDPKYEENMNLAFTEAQRRVGEELLQGPDKEFHRQDAAETAQKHIALEADRGNLDPEYQNSVQAMMANPDYDTAHVAGQPPETPLQAGMRKATGG